MKKITIEGIKTNNNTLLIDKYKFLFGFDIEIKFNIRNSLKKYFEKESKLDYDIENNINNIIKINERIIDTKQYNYIELHNLYDIKEDLKLGTKSLLQKYYELYLEQIEYNELFITINNLLKSLDIEIDLNLVYNDIAIYGQVTDITKKTLIKMIEVSLVKKELDISSYSLSYSDTILIQLELIKKIAKLDHNKEYIVLI